jgi:glyoxylase-like metal-dependent hydrolase (beta-lactamase superfamily II)
MNEVVPGIYQLKLPVPLLGDQLAVNAYLIQSDKGWLLVDSGWNTNEAFAALGRQFSEVGIRFEDISQIIITHFHPDHYGLAGRVAELSGAKAALHQVEKAFIDSRYINMESLLNETADLLRVHGVPEPELPHLQRASVGVRQFVLAISPETTLYGGEVIHHGRFDFEVVWTPGHSPGHVCLYERARRILLSGDHILPNTFPNVSLHPQSGEDPLGNYLRSLAIVDGLDVDLVLPAHEHVFTGLKQRIRELYQHHKDRKAAIINALREGPKTAYQVSMQIPWILNGVSMSFEELPSLDKRLAVMSAMAHLEPLCAEGRAERIREDSTVVYSARAMQ